MADYAGNYAGNIAGIYRDLGRSQAEAKLRKGAAWGQAISDIGQTVAGIPGQLRAEKRQAQEDQLWEANFADFQQKRKENQAIKDAINSSVGQDGQIDERRLAENFQLMGMADLTERALQPIRESKVAALNLRHAEAQGVMDQAALGELRKAAIAPFASVILESNGDPKVMEGVIAAIRIATPELGNAIEHDLGSAKPADVKRFAESLIPTAKEKPPLITKPGDIARDPNDPTKILFQNPAEEKPKPTPSFREGVVDGKLRILQWDPQSGAFVPTNAAPPPTQSSGGGSGSSVAGGDADAIADAIINGQQPPVLTGLYRFAAPVRAALAKKGYNLTDAMSDWTATQKFIASTNGVKQTTLRQAVDTAYHSLDVIDDLSSQWKGGQFPLLNKVNLAAAVNGAYGPQAQSIATQLQAQITDLTSELGQVYMGGNSPTDHALELAGKNLSANWSDKVLRDMTGLARKNLQIRQNSLMNARPAGTGENPYSQPTQAPQGAPQFDPAKTAVADLTWDPVSKKFIKKGGG